MASDRPQHAENPAPTPPVNSRGCSQQEVGALLRLVGVLGLTVALGIGGFFFLGLLADERWQLGGSGILVGVLSGIGLSLYWAYRSIARHLDRFAPKDPHKDEPAP